MNAAKIALAASSGLSVVCASCTRYWEGRDRGLPEPRCTSRSSCGSPLSGDDFHEYDGPLHNFEEWCFRCGASSSYLVVLTNPTQRRIGVCAAHVQMFNELRPVAVPSPELLLRGAGSLIRPEDIRPRPRKSLIASILEVERQFEDQDQNR